MANYYVSPSGADSNNGLGPDASSSTNRPFQTLARAIGSSGVAVAGDTVYLAPGVYRGSVSIGVDGASGNRITIAGDPANGQGFKDAAGNRISPGEVRLTPYDIDDRTAPSSNTTPLILQARGYLTFRNLWIVGGRNAASATAINTASNGAGRGISFIDCVISQGYAPMSADLILYNGSADGSGNGVPADWTFERCTFLSINRRCLSINGSTANVDYSLNFQIRNCLFLGGNAGVQVGGSGSGAGKPGGVSINACTFLGQSPNCVATGNANVSTTDPVDVRHSILITTNTALSANVLGQIVEDYNLIASGSSYGSISAGAHTQRSGDYSLNVDIGQSRIWGQSPRPFFTPTAGSPLLGFGGDSTAPTTDWANRARPEGGRSTANAVGYLERHDTAAQETTTTDSGPGIRIEGPGSHEFALPVDAVATAISVKARFDSAHGPANKPQAILLSAAEIGVSAQSLTMSAPVDTWETLTFAPITPTARGVVTIRLVSRAAAGNGRAFFDTFQVQ
jgi:hypothetical protein